MIHWNRNLAAADDAVLDHPAMPERAIHTSVESKATVWPKPRQPESEPLPFSEPRGATDILNFILIHKIQFRQKASRHAWIDFYDYQNEVVLVILEKEHKFDPSRGSFAGFVFGHVEKRLRRYKDDALSRSSSMDDDSDRGVFFRSHAESMFAVDLSTKEICAYQTTEVVPGAGDLASIADAISGMNASEIGLRMGIGKRAVNMKLARAKADAKRQSSLFKFCGEAV